MKRRGYLLIIAVLLMLAVGRAALAESSRVNRSDIATTRMYLEDRRDLARAETHDRPAAQAAVGRLIAHVRSGRPDVLAGAPQTSAVEALWSQALAQVSHADGEPSRKAVIDRIGDSGNKVPGVSLTRIGDGLTAAQIRAIIVTGKPPMPASRRMPTRKLDALVRFLAMLRREPRHREEDIDVMPAPGSRRKERAVRTDSNVAGSVRIG